MLLEPTAVESVILATLALYNLLMTSSAKICMLPNRIMRHRECKSEGDTRSLEK